MPRRNATLLAAILLSSGCGVGEPRVPVYPVSGTILQGGKPLAKVIVRFHPVTPPRGARPDDPASAIRVVESDADGKYELNTYKGGDGAPAGDYVVTIAPGGGPDPEERDGPPRPARIPAALAKYANKATSPLKATVKPGENPAFDFDLK